MNRPASRRNRQNGRHETGAQATAQTVPDTPADPDVEEPMTVPAPSRQPAPAEVLDDLLALYEQAQHRVRESSGTLPAVEKKIRDCVKTGDKHRETAADLRRQADELRRQADDEDALADDQFSAAQELGKQRDRLCHEVTTQQARADYHGSMIDVEVAMGAEDPRVRRERIAAEEAAKRAAAGQTFPQPSALDGPNRSLMAVTHPFPAEGNPDATQAARIVGGAQ